jgi:hypothetical protein
VSITVRTDATMRDVFCDACGGTKDKPHCARVDVGPECSFVLCTECARDLANAVGFAALSTGWSKLEPRKRKARL